ncbi:glycosyltransferase [Desulfosoma sp.]|uniref:glycosyltransferase n=1 Tax=Desulfosoma sp. TaxID=2603217 RepID=UPI00404A120D
MVLTSTYPRWAEDREPRFVYDLSRRLARTFEVHVAASHAPGAGLRERMDGMMVHRFQYFPQRLQELSYEGGVLEKIKRKPWALFQVPGFLAAQITLIRRPTAQIPFDAIHARWILPQGWCAVLAQTGRRFKVPILCTSPGGDLFGLRGPLFDALRRWVLQRLAAVTVVSRAMAERMASWGIRTPRHVLPMETDLTTLFTPTPETPRRRATILFVGRLVEKKGVRYLIDAFEDVRRRMPQAELWIVGSGPEETFLKKRASAVAPVRSRDSLPRNFRPSALHPHPGTITFFGSVAHKDLADFYRSATVTVVPSVAGRSGDQEGLGLVLVEAMECGCPVIASDLPAVRDVIRHGETGLLVPPEKVRLMADEITNALSTPHLLEKLSKNGSEWIRARFDWNQTAEKSKNLFLSLISKNSL